MNTSKCGKLIQMTTGYFQRLSLIPRSSTFQDDGWINFLTLRMFKMSNSLPTCASLNLIPLRCPPPPPSWGKLLIDALFHSNFQDIFYFFTTKTFLVECLRSSRKARGRCKLGILAWNAHTSVTSDWTYHFSHTWNNNVCSSHWKYHLFHVWKTLFIPLIG